jgi:hypothetical protein
MVFYLFTSEEERGEGWREVFGWAFYGWRVWWRVKQSGGV